MIHFIRVKKLWVMHYQMYFFSKIEQFSTFIDFVSYGNIDGRLNALLSFSTTLFANVSYLFIGKYVIRGAIEISDVLMYAGVIQMLRSMIQTQLQTITV